MVAATKHISGTFTELCAKPAVKQLVLEELARTHKAAKLQVRQPAALHAETGSRLSLFPTPLPCLRAQGAKLYSLY